ncbi:MAG: molybdopterin converting factor subunit 1 [Gammaproteobacteria bacterium]|nr:molybdopterin converting factor subunit 1 [Gammaproteobacteria bacterium]
MLKVVFFARLRELMKIDEVSIEFPEDNFITVQQALKIMTDNYSAFNEYIEQGHRIMIAVNQSMTDQRHQLKPGDELALFPPVTGG